MFPNIAFALLAIIVAFLIASYIFDRVQVRNSAGTRHASPARVGGFKFALQLFDIAGTGGNGFPQQVLDVMQQKNYLETRIRLAIRPTIVLRPKTIGNMDWFDARIGESKTFTRQALLAPSISPLNPANNTGLDNGMTAQSRSWEQWTATLNEYANFLPTNILGQEAFLGDIYLDNIDAISQMAGNSLEVLCVQRAILAYMSGDTFATTGATGTPTVLHLDDGYGFDKTFPSAELPLYAPPSAISTSNKIAIAVIAASTGLITGLSNAQAWSPDVSNTSSMISGTTAFGISGAITLDVAIAPVTKGDRVVALDPAAALNLTPPVVGGSLNPVWKDGPQVVRPLDTNGNQITTAYALTAANKMNPSFMIPAAVAILKRRNVPTLSNGLYGCAIDSTLLASFYGDTGFQRATATNWDRGNYFANGVIAAGWGVEFTEATQLPVYNAPGGGGFQLRHGFVFGQDVISEHPFTGARTAASIVAGVGDVADERWTDRIKIRSLAALDVLGQVIKVAYDYVGDFVPGTDKGSNPNIVLTSDYSRYKRGVVLEAASPY